MYNWIDGSSYFASSPLDEADDQNDADSFADALRQLRLAPPNSSGTSSSAPRPYWLDSSPPVVEIDMRLFRKAAEGDHSDEIRYIADNPQEHSDFASQKAARTAEVAEEYGTTRDSVNARYFSYQLGNKCVGLLRMEGGDSMTNFDVEKWQELFPGDLGRPPL
ncbi:hypothetical protein [Bradyrhizobium sp. CCBAU 53380]|uniref:hypothetical protein n=1 Tax=Bradyrhizobium sp. CCBAU 53380 TaxID=1325117 RepID=UPI00230359DC|nr:hypothetical protein [Bradyrhizobium sp. CCBAU 53380]